MNQIKISRTVIVIVFVLFNVILIRAEENEEKEEKKYFSSTSLSLLLTRGNNRDLSFSFDTDQNFNFKKDKFNLKASIIHTRSTRREKTEIYNSQLKYNHQMNSRAYLLGLVVMERNKSAGYDFRFALSLGAGYRLLQQEKIEVSADISVGWTRENFWEESLQDEVRASSSYVSSILSTSLIYNFSSSSQFILQEDFFFNLQDPKDWRIRSTSSITASISRYFALKTSLQLFYEHQPVPGFKSTDFFLLNSLVIKF